MNQDQPVVVALGELLWDVFPDGARFGSAPGNFAHHASALGGNTLMVSAVGDDDLGHRAIDSLNRSRIDVSQVGIDTGHPTGTVNVLLDDRGSPSYQFHQDEAWDYLSWRDELAKLAGRCDAVCFGTLGQRSEQARETIQRFVSATHPSAIRIFDVNLRQPFYTDQVIRDSLALANVLKLNDDELDYLVTLFGLRSNSEIDQADEIRERFELKLVAVTRGERGALVIQKDSFVEVEAQITEVSDTVGAGDAFSAALTLGLLREIDMRTLTESACRIAEYVCSQSGATPAMPNSLLTAFSFDSDSDSSLQKGQPESE